MLLGIIPVVTAWFLFLLIVVGLVFVRGRSGESAGEASVHAVHRPSLGQLDRRRATDLPSETDSPPAVPQDDEGRVNWGGIELEPVTDEATVAIDRPQALEVSRS